MEGVEAFVFIKTSSLSITTHPHTPFTFFIYLFMIHTSW